MSGQLIDGKKISSEIKEEVKKSVSELKEKNIVPCLAVIIVGDDPASLVYVKNKKEACDFVGIKSITYKMAADTLQDELMNVIEKLNNDKEVNGILVQLPLPSHLDEFSVICKISPQKDVDGFHPENVGLLSIGQANFIPATPAGIIALLKRSSVEIPGKRCVVIGRSNIVGKPVSYLMLKENATVTICHSKTAGLSEICREADILIAAVGKAKMVKADMIKSGAVLIDVGMNRDEEGKLCGDIDFSDCKEKASALTPVPGGVGPMTIALLMQNCLIAAMKQNNIACNA